MASHDNQHFRFGSASFAGTRDLRRAGMLTQKDQSLLVGFWGRRPIWYSGAGGLLLTAGARGGKLKDVLAYNICARIHPSTMLILDMKGELAAISQDQAPDNKHCAYWNPAGLHGLAQNRLNPLSHIHARSPHLVSDVKVFCENFITSSGSAQGVYFEGRAREFLEAIALTLTRIKGVLCFPDLYHVINLIPGGSDDWLGFAFEMVESGFPIARRIEEEIANSRDHAGNGFQGIMGEIFRAFAALSDPMLMRSVSPPYDFDLADLCASHAHASGQTYNLYLMPPAEYVAPWAPIIRSILTAAMLHKARAPDAPRQTWVLDECAQLGGFPLVPKIFTYGAGIGIRPWAVFQSGDQMDALAPRAGSIITASAALRSYFAIRDIATASAVSRMLGAQTLIYDDDQQQARASHAKHQALQRMLMGDDPFSTGLDYIHHKRASAMTTKQHRLLRTPDEVLNTPANKQFIFVDGLSKPIYADRRAYFEQAFMRGRYQPNPYHPAASQSHGRTGWGAAMRFWRGLT